MIFISDSNGAITAKTAIEIMVASQIELAKVDLSDVPPGSVAYTPGFESMWQLSASGSWVSIL